MTSGLKRICASAFAMCAQLKEISLPDGLVRIGDSAFCYCDSLENVPLPPTLEEIGEKAFAECRSLKNLTIPAAVHAIGETAFVSCFALENLRIELENQWARMQFPFVLGNRGTSLLWTRHDRGLRDYVIPDGVTDIGPGAFTPFLETGSLTFPASVKRISMIALPVSTKKVVFLGIPEEISLLVLDRYAPDLTIVVPSKVENGSFHDWIQTQEEHGCRIVYPEAEP